MAVGDLASVRIRTATYPDNNENAWGFTALTADPDWRQLLVDEWCVGILPIYVAGLVDICEVRNVICRDEVPGVGADRNGNRHGIDTGQVVDDPVSPQVAGLLQWRSGLIGRSKRGRTYIPAMPRSRLNSEGRVWDGPAQDYLANMVAFMLSVYGPGGSSIVARLVVISRQLDLEPQDPWVGYPIESGDYSAIVASQRRRVGR